MSSSTKQKLNTRSSTETELVAVHDRLPDIIWTRYFLKWQGYNSEMILYQDNMSAMLLEKNGKRSSSKRTKHINIRFYFITDRYEKGDVQIVHCGTETMLADYFTKPLQGKKFLEFRKRIMNEKCIV